MVGVRGAEARASVLRRGSRPRDARANARVRERASERAQTKMVIKTTTQFSNNLFMRAVHLFGAMP